VAELNGSLAVLYKGDTVARARFEQLPADAAPRPAPEAPPAGAEDDGEAQYLAQARNRKRS
jgi:hypothetical protein